MQDKFFSNNKYDDLIQELHEEEILDDNDLDIIKNEYNSYKNKDDDLERLWKPIFFFYYIQVS